MAEKKIKVKVDVETNAANSIADVGCPIWSLTTSIFRDSNKATFVTVFTKFFPQGL